MGMGQRRIVLLVLAALVLGGLVWVPAASAAGEEANILGYVQGTGYKFTTPLPNAYLELWRAEGTPGSWTFTNTNFTAITDWSGWYNLTTDAALPLYYGANMAFWPFVENYEQVFSPMFSLAPYEVKVVNIKLQVLPSNWSGKVVKKQGGHPLGKVKVAVAGKYVYTANNGKWKIPGMLLQPGVKYKVTYTKSGYKKIEKSYMSSPTNTGEYFGVGTVKMVKK